MGPVSVLSFFGSAPAWGGNYAFAPVYVALQKGSGVESESEGENTKSIHGLALFSRWPMKNVHAIPLPNGKDKMWGKEKRLGYLRALIADIPLVIEMVPAGMEVLLGNGSDDLIQIVTAALAKPGAVMMYPGPTFVMYAMNATYFGLRAVETGLREDFSLDADAFIERMRASPVDKDAAAGDVAAMRQLFTKSVVARVDLAAGTVLRPEHLSFKKPGTGIPIRRLPDLVGRRLRRALAADELLREDDVEESTAG